MTTAARSVDGPLDDESRAAFGAVFGPIVPPLRVITPWVTNNPSPVPLPAAFVVKKGSQMRPRCSGAMPAPVSSTTSSTMAPRRAVRAASVPPASMACTAFIIRFMHTPRIPESRAHGCGTAASHAFTNVTACWRIWNWSSEAVSATARFRSTHEASAETGCASSMSFCVVSRARRTSRSSSCESSSASHVSASNFCAEQAFEALGGGPASRRALLIRGPPRREHADQARRSLCELRSSALR